MIQSFNRLLTQRSQLAPHGGRNHAQFIHELRKLVRIERLRAVRKRLVRIRMHFDQQHVGPCSHGGSRHRRNFVAQASAMRRIRCHGQMRKLVDDGNRRDVQRIARVSLERANAALAQDDIIIATGHNVLGREQQFFKRGSDASLEHHRLLYLAQFPQQIEVLHVARADLQDIDVGQHHGHLRNFHHFADHQHAKAVSGFAKQFERFEAQPLERVWRGTWLECAAAQRPCTRFRYLLGSRKKLLARFHRAWPGHDDNLIPTNCYAIRETYERPLRTKTTPRELVRSADAVHVLHSGQHFEIARIEIYARAHRRQNGLALARRAVYRKAHPDQVLDDLLDLLLTRRFLHCNDHKRQLLAISCWHLVHFHPYLTPYPSPHRLRAAERFPLAEFAA